MTNRFLISVAAAALIAGTGFANAQGAGGGKEGGGAGSTYQQNAPSSGGGAAQRRDDSGMKSGQSEKGMKSEKAPGGKQAEDMKGGMKGEGKDKSGTVGQAPDKGSKDMKAEGRDKDKSGTVGQAPEKGGAQTQGREEKGGAMGRDKDKSGTTTQQREDKSGTMQQGQKDGQGQKGAQGTQTQQGSQTTTGMAPAAPPPEKQTQISTAIKSERIEETTNVNFNVSVGAVVPTSVRFHPIPARIVEIYPEWRGYQVIFVKGRYIIVRPQTHEIVYIIEG